MAHKWSLAERDQKLLTAIEKKQFIVDNGNVINTRTQKTLGKHFSNDNSPLNFAFDGIVVVAKRVRFLWLYYKGAIPANHVPMVRDTKLPLNIDNLHLVNKAKAVIDHTAINKNQRLTDEQVKALRELYAETPFSLIEKAVEIELSSTTLRKLLLGESYRHVDGPIATPQQIKDNHKRIGRSVTSTFSIYERDRGFIQMIRDGRLRVEENKIFNGENGRELAAENRRDNQAITGKYNNIQIAIMRSRLLWLYYKGEVPKDYRPTRIDPKGPVVIENLHLIKISEFCSQAAKKATKRFDVGKHRGHANSVKLDGKVLALRQEYKRTPFAIGERARSLQVTPKTLSDALKGNTYKDIPDAVRPETIQAYTNIGRTRVLNPSRPTVEFKIPKPERIKPERKKAEPRPVIKPARPKPTVIEKSLIPAIPKPVVQKPVVQKPVVQKPVVQKPVVQKPVVEAPVKNSLPKTVVVDRTEALEKQRRDRLFSIKMAAQRLEQRKGLQQLTAFKRFAVYHLNYIGYGYTDIKQIVPDLENETVLQTVVQAFPAETYESERQKLLATYGEDSKMLVAIKINEVRDEKFS